MPRPRSLALALALACAGCSEPQPPRSQPAKAGEAPADRAASETSPSQPAPETAVARPETAAVAEAEPSDATPPLAATAPPENAPAEPRPTALADDPPEAGAPEAKPGPTFTVVARLVDRGTPTSHCGVFHFKAVMKYEVLRVVDGRFEGDTLYAAVSCPEMPPSGTRKFRFAEGETYQLRLRTAGVRRGGIRVDAFEGEPGKRYELLHIEPAPAPATAG